MSNQFFNTIYFKIKFFFLRLFPNEETKRKINTVAQIVFGVMFILLAIYILGKFVINMGSYPTSLTGDTYSYWYDKDADAMLSAEDGKFEFVSLEHNIQIEGDVTAESLVIPDITINYSIEDGYCIMSYQGVNYKLSHVNQEYNAEVISDFEERASESSKEEIGTSATK